MENSVNRNSSVPQAVLQPYQWRSNSSLSLHGQGGEHAVSCPSDKNGGFTFCYPPAWSVILQKRKVSGAEDCSKRAMSEFEEKSHALLMKFLHHQPPCYFCWTFQLRRWACSSPNAGRCSACTVSATVHTWSGIRPEGVTIVLITSNNSRLCLPAPYTFSNNSLLQQYLDRRKERLYVFNNINTRS